MKRILLISLLFFSLVGWSQQWSVTNSVTLLGQGKSIAPTALFTPNQDGFYRVSFYLSATGSGKSPGGIVSEYDATDITGYPVSKQLNFSCNGGQYMSLGPLFYALKAGEPFTYYVALAGTGCDYNIGLVVEQLQ